SPGPDELPYMDLRSLARRLRLQGVGRHARLHLVHDVRPAHRRIARRTGGRLSLDEGVAGIRAFPWCAARKDLARHSRVFRLVVSRVRFHRRLEDARQRYFVSGGAGNPGERRDQARVGRRAKGAGRGMERARRVSVRLDGGFARLPGEARPRDELPSARLFGVGARLGRSRNLESIKVIGSFFTLVVAAAATIAASDSSSYVVLNHGRRAGDMVIVSAGDSTVVRFIFVDRNRGTLIKSSCRFAADKRLVSSDVRPIAANGQALEPNAAFEIRGDSIHWSI